MSTSKLLLCVLGAAAAGVVVGKLLTTGNTNVVSSIRDAAGDLFGKVKSNVDRAGGGDSRQRAEFDQANTTSPGHA